MVLTTEFNIGDVVKVDDIGEYEILDIQITYLIQ